MSTEYTNGTIKEGGGGIYSSSGAKEMGIEGGERGGYRSRKAGESGCSRTIQTGGGGHTSKGAAEEGVGEEGRGGDPRQWKSESRETAKGNGP